MKVLDFKVWLLKNNYTQRSLADRLQISENTVGNYVKNDRFPTVFVLALKGLEL